MTLALVGGLAMMMGLLCLGRWYYLRKQEEEKKDFVVIGTTLFLIWLFPGAALVIIGLVLIALLCM